jgi:hypothetical protein
MDRIVWIEVEDRPSKPRQKPNTLSSTPKSKGFRLLGEPHRREGDGTGTRLVRWDFPGGEAVERTQHGRPRQPFRPPIDHWPGF